MTDDDNHLKNDPARFDRFDLESVAATLAAMANTRHGGTVILHVSGDSLAAIDSVLQAALSLTPPLIIPLPRVTREKDQSVVITQIPAGMPHVYALDGRYLTREGAENSPLHPRDLRRLLIERGEISFETEVTPHTTRDDLDWDKIREYAGKLQVSDAEQLLLKRACLVDVHGELYPTNAGILLFGKDPQRHLRGADITAVRFAGEIMSDKFSRQDINGTLPDQIRRAETFLIDHLRKEVELHDKMARKEQFEYPLEAARELLVNAVAHRDYSISGDGIRLYLFKDRMEITSPGLLPGPVTIANIVEERFSRNPAIVQVLADMGYIERLGYGVDRVIELMKQQQLRAPQFVETGGGFRVMLFNTPVTDQPAPQKPDKPAPKKVSPPVVMPTPRPLEQYRDVALNSRQETALLYLLENSRITNSELQKMHPDVHPETIRRDLADLVTRNILNKMGEKRGSYYVLKRED